MKLSIQLIFLCIIFFSSNLALGQKKIKKKDQEEIQRVCDVYLRQHNIILSDYSAPSDSLLDVVSTPVSTMILARRAYFEKMEYEDLFFPEYKIIELELEDSIGCVVNNADEDISFKINVKEVNDSWMIVGYDNHEIDQADIDEHNEFIVKELKTLVVKDSIKEILKEFVSAWSELSQTKKSEVLKSVTTTEFYDYLVTKMHYEDLQDYPSRKMIVKDLGRVDIHMDTARCRLAIKGNGGATMILLRQNNTWRIAGENDRLFTREDVKNIEDDIAHFHEFEKFNAQISLFNDQLEKFLKTGNRALLEEAASAHFIDQLEIYRRLFGTIDTNYLSLYGVGRVHSHWNLKIKEDTAYCISFPDSIGWVKKNNKWFLDDLFAQVTEANHFKKAHQTFRAFTDEIHLSYSVYNTLDENSAPPIVSVPKPTDYSRVHFHHRLDDYHKEIVYQAGNEQLFADIKNEIAKVSSETAFKGVIYVEFYVDHLGKIQKIHALNQIGSNEAQLAQDIVGNLGDWFPNDNKQSSLTNMVLPIQF